MFTGLVADRGEIVSLEQTPDGIRIGVRTALAAELAEGDSVAVDGVCLTATAVSGEGFTADVMNQTVRSTALAGLLAGRPVNLELPLRPSDRLGGHIVQGHVDGTGTVERVKDDGFARRLTIGAPPELLRYIAVKGSITVNGVSLTVAELADRSFTVSLIPETLERTNLGAAEPGDTMNLEVDVLAKYVERLMTR